MFEVPCFHCLLMNRIKASICDPAKCEEISEWLFSITQAQVCSHPHNFAIKNGFITLHGKKVQRYRCLYCGKRFTRAEGYDFKMKHPRKVINFALNLSQQTDPPYSSRDIAGKIQETFGIKVSHVTVVNWINSSCKTKRTSND